MIIILMEYCIDAYYGIQVINLNVDFGAKLKLQRNQNSSNSFHKCKMIIYELLRLSTQILGIDSEFCIVESFITGMVDYWPDTLRPHRIKFTIAICMIMFALGVPMVTNVSIRRTMSIYRHARSRMYNRKIQTRGEKLNKRKIKMLLFRVEFIFSN